jgi:uncharacterized protein
LGTVKPIIHSRTRRWKYTRYAGHTGSRFLIELRDNKRIMGTKCHVCHRVYVPARSFCYVCFKSIAEWVEVSNEGTLTAFTMVYQSEPSYPVKTPFAYGIIKLDGVDTGLAHIIGEVNPEDLRIGMRVQAVFKENRIGSILDIQYFKPI